MMLGIPWTGIFYRARITPPPPLTPAAVLHGWSELLNWEH
jgi:hypothetical protein